MGTTSRCRTSSLDGAALVIPWVLAACAGVNHAPSAPEIDIEPAMPHTLDDLRLVITKPAEDPEGDSLLYHTRWFQNGEIRDRVRGDVVPAQRTGAGEYWIAELWASDGLLESPVAEATAYVFNTAPEARVRLRPAGADTRDDLTASASGSDIDGHEVELEYTWSVDGAHTEHLGAVVEAASTAKHQRWAVEVLPYDGDSWGQAVTAELVINNAAPGSPVVGFSPEQPRLGRDDIQCVVLEASEDADGDSLDYRVAWSLDGEPFEETIDTDLVGDTVPGEETGREQRWECRIWADDGETEGPPGRGVLTL